MKKKKSPLFVFFNASVILAGLKSQKGASANLLSLAQKRKIEGTISEIVIDEVLRHTTKMGLNPKSVTRIIRDSFKIIKAPDEITVNTFKNIVIDLGDAHILASTCESRSKFLVTLDKKHILSLKNKIKEYQIISPGDLFNLIKRKNFI